MSQAKNHLAGPAQQPRNPTQPAPDQQNKGGQPRQRQDNDHGLSDKGVGGLGTGVDTGGIQPGKSGEGHSLP